MEVCVVPVPREGRENMTQQFFSESLILAQFERWQCGLGVQVEGDLVGSYGGR